MSSISTSAVTQALVAAGLTPGPTVPGATQGTVDPGAAVPRPDTVSPGFAGFLAVFLLACATVLLMRSMTKHLRKVRYSAEPPAPAKITAQTPPGSGDGEARPT